MMRDFHLLQRLKRLESEAKEHEQKEENSVSVVFYVPDVEGEPVPEDAPPATADGLRPYTFIIRR